eukprot:scaffold5855_cov117-Isochrysis_galbana.AAC.9
MFATAHGTWHIRLPPLAPWGGVSGVIRWLLLETPWRGKKGLFEKPGAWWGAEAESGLVSQVGAIVPRVIYLAISCQHRVPHLADRRLDFHASGRANWEAQFRPIVL